MDLAVISEAAVSMHPLPITAVRLAAMTADPSPDLAAIVEVVGFDQAVTTTLLRAANSSWSSPRTPVTTVKDAVVRLGAGSVLTLTVGVALRTHLQHSVPEYALDENELWRHSVAASLAAEILMSVSARRLPPETATAALLHDIGKLVMARHVDPVDLRAIDAARELGATRNAAEYEVLGVDHAELGAVVAQAWDLPDSLVAAIAHHHSPRESDAPIAYGVHIADVVAKAIGIGRDDNADLEAYTCSMGELGLTAAAFDTVCATVTARFADVASRYA